MRFNKYVASTGICSRREADRLIREGLVLLNGVVETNPAIQVLPEKCRISFVFDPEQRHTTSILLYKPRGVVVTRSSKEGTNVYDILPDNLKQLSAIGRLDKDSEGLLLLSDDSSLPRFIIGEDNHCEKEYVVKVNENISESSLDKMRKGMIILNSRTKPAKVRKLNGVTFSITLKEGKNRQIRRMCRKIGREVISLKRVRIGFLKTGSLTPGTWRTLTQNETDMLKKISPYL